MNSKPENNIGSIGNRERSIEIIRILEMSMRNHTFRSRMCATKKRKQIENPKKMYEEKLTQKCDVNVEKEKRVS